MTRRTRLRDPLAPLLERSRSSSEAVRRAACQELFERLRDPVYGVCLRVLGSRSDAQDAAQETLVALFRRLGEFRFEAKVTSWAHAIAFHAAIDLRRRREVRRAASLDELRAHDDEHGFDLPDPEEDRPLARLAQAEAGDELRAGLGRLSPKLRTVLSLRYLDGLSNGEIENRLRVPSGTVKSRLARAHRALEVELRRSA